MARDLVEMAADRQLADAAKRLRTAPHGQRRRRQQDFIAARHAQLRAEMKVSSKPARR